MKTRLIICVYLITISCTKEVLIDKSKVLPFFNSEEFTPQWIAKGDVEFDEIHTIAPFEFTNQHGERVTNNDFEGKIYIADFFFTSCPSICPILAKNMAAIQDVYKDDDNIMLLSHSVMPWIDSVDKVKNYAVEKGAIDGKWHLVTGNRDAIYELARTSYFADEDFKRTKDKSEFIHTENFILIDKKGRIRGVYNGTLSVEVKRLQAHIEKLKKEG